MFKTATACLVVLLSTHALAGTTSPLYTNDGNIYDEELDNKMPAEEVPTEDDFPDQYQSHKPVHCEKLKIALPKFHRQPDEKLVATFLGAFNGYPGMIYYNATSNTITIMDFLPTQVRTSPDSEPVVVGQAACYTTLGVDVNWMKGIEISRNKKEM